MTRRAGAAAALFVLAASATARATATAAVAAPPAGAATFGAIVFTPVVGAAFALPHVVGLAPVPGSWAVTLTRTVDPGSVRLERAHTSLTHFKKLSLAWSGPAGVKSLCLADVAVTSHSTRPVPGGGRSIEHSTLLFTAAAAVDGLGACRKTAAAPPVVVRVFTESTGPVRARVDCLIARCAGRLRLLCPTEGCPGAGLAVGSFALGPGEQQVLPVALARKVRGRHPKLTANVTLKGRAQPIVTSVIVDPPPPAGLPTVTSTKPAASSSPDPPGSAAGSGGPTDATPGSGTGSGSTPGGTGTPPGGTGVPGTGGGGGGSGSGNPPPGGGEPLDTSLTISCDGAVDHLSAVHGALSPSLAGRTIEIDYVPVDPTADTIIHNVTTHSGGRFTDAAGAPFVRAIAFYGGDDTYLPSDAFCPPA